MEKLAELRLAGAGFTEGGAKPANFPIEAAALNRNMVLVAYARGVAVISTAVPQRPLVEQIIDVGGAAVSVDVLGDTALVAVSMPDPALVVLDFSTAPARVIKRIPLAAGTFLAAVALLPEKLVVAAGDQGVLVFDR